MQDVLRFRTEMVPTNPCLHLARRIVKRDIRDNNKNVSYNPVAPQLDYFWQQEVQSISGGCNIVYIYTSSDARLPSNPVYYSETTNVLTCILF